MILTDSQVPMGVQIVTAIIVISVFALIGLTITIECALYLISTVRREVRWIRQHLNNSK